ncbi:amine oxidase [Rhizopogon vinicolor AM-OR11-026]|uniref:Amine oxidase n=1 Tax=Rhizopogon vinicolor AM-OR11-026 TaxID=1314800 RepID=A0A1B7MSY3_9AGAM|nr:amine oxidase [Rhizopogon vinicolor AM-OR11-026]
MRIHSALFFSLVAVSATVAQKLGKRTKDAQVLILGGGMAGTIAARTLHEKGIEDFIILEGKTELGGRILSDSFGATGKNFTVEMGPSWIHGTQTGNGTANPVYSLALKHNLSMANNDWYGNITTYDYTGANNYLSVFHNAVSVYKNATVLAGERVDKKLVDMSLQSGYMMLNATAKTPQQAASEYYQADWTPAQTSLIASSWRHNFTYDTDVGGFSLNNSMSIDPRGFKAIVQAEAQEFLQPQQLLLNHTVAKIEYDSDGVTVTITNGTVLTADYVLCTFSVGVLQNTDVVFEPKLPDWKVEAISSIDMTTETKIYLQFAEKFWFNTQMALYADETRGRYPVWQSLDQGGFYPGSGIIFVTVTGSESVRVNSLNDTQVQAEVMEVLQTMYPNTTIPQPTAFHLARWNTNTIYRGAYSNWPASFVNGHAQNLRATVGDRVWFAGEATSLKYYGSLQGAYFEGEDVGTQLAECIQEGDCDSLGYVEDVMNARPYTTSNTTSD